MELDDSKRYAAAGLFTLSLHSTQTESGVAGENPFASDTFSAWGQLPDSEMQSFLFGDTEDPTANASWDQFWGFDCVAKEGLCERAYNHLGLPETAWPGLKQLPQVVDVTKQRQMVQEFLELVDSDFSGRPLPAIPNLPPKPAEAPDPSQLAPADESEQGDEEDEDIKADIRRAQMRARTLMEPEAPKPEAVPTADLLSLDDGTAEPSKATGSSPEALLDNAAKAPEPPPAPMHLGGAPQALASTGVTGQADPFSSTESEATTAADAPCASVDDCMTASELAESPGAQVGPSAYALAALTQLLAASIAAHYMPTLQDMLKEAQEGEKGKTGKKGKGPKQRQAAVRWYDARARVSLRRMAAWLDIPWDRVAAYECLLAQAANQDKESAEPEGKPELSAAQKRMKYLKIGAAAVGGGALLAVTGGLAAPALAAIAGTALTTVGGSAAAAGALTGFLGSSVGAAAIIGGLGAGGAYGAGGTMAKRIGEVKEFGFREIGDDAPRTTHFAANDQPEDPSAPEEDVGKALEASAADAPEQGSLMGKPSPAESPSASKAEETTTLGSVGRFLSFKKDSDSSTGDKGKQGSGSTSSWSLPWSKPQSKPEEEEAESALLPIPVSSIPRAVPRLSVVVGVAGWVTCQDDFVGAWQHVGCADCERYGLVWETEELVKLNDSIMKMIKAMATKKGAEMLAGMLVHGVMAAVALPYTAWSALGLLDSQWAKVLNRAARAGELLAHVLMSGAHGGRPVTLIGYSMGARLIYHCLLELARCRCKGTVEHAFMLGTPVVIQPERYALARSAVAGRCVNAYSTNDWVLSLNFRARSGLLKPPAGICAVPVVGIENVDTTELVDGHQAYTTNMDAILDSLSVS